MSGDNLTKASNSHIWVHNCTSYTHMGLAQCLDVRTAQWYDIHDHHKNHYNTCTRLLHCSVIYMIFTIIIIGKHTTALGSICLPFPPTSPPLSPSLLGQAMVASNSLEGWYADPRILRQSVAAYPTLQAALFPPPPTNLTPAQSQDVTVYTLLQVIMYVHMHT